MAVDPVAWPQVRQPLAAPLQSLMRPASATVPPGDDIQMHPQRPAL